MITSVLEAKEYSQDNLLPEFLATWQFAANLLGESADPTEFDGKVMGEEDRMQELLASESTARLYLLHLRGKCNVYMGNWEAAKQQLDVLHNILGTMAGKAVAATHYNLPLTYTYYGVCCYKVYAKNRSRGSLSKAEFSLKTLSRWASKGALNVVTGLWFVQAQQSTLEQGLDVVKQRFDKAIAGLHRCGLRGFEALACESFAEFAQKSGDQVLATDYMRRAHEVYAGWGALAKLQQMEKRYASMFQDVDLEAVRRSANKRKVVPGARRSINEDSFRAAQWWSRVPGGIDIKGSS